MSERLVDAATAETPIECTYLHLPVDPRHPRLRFLEGAPEGGEPAPEPEPEPEPKPDGDTPPEGEEDLGDAGKKALDAMKAQRKAANDRAKAAEERATALETALAAKDKPAEEQALDAARAEARAEAQKAADARILKSELRAVAAGKLANPADALAFIDLSEFTVDADGEPDSDALNEAITDLLKARPYLAANPNQNPFQGQGDGGAKPPAKPEATLDEQIAEANAKNDFRTVIRLQNQKLELSKA